MHGRSGKLLKINYYSLKRKRDIKFGLQAKLSVGYFVKYCKNGFCKNVYGHYISLVPDPLIFEQVRMRKSSHANSLAQESIELFERVFGTKSFFYK